MLVLSLLSFILPSLLLLLGSIQLALWNLKKLLEQENAHRPTLLLGINEQRKTEKMNFSLRNYLTTVSWKEKEKVGIPCHSYNWRAEMCLAQRKESSRKTAMLSGFGKKCCHLLS